MSKSALVTGADAVGRRMEKLLETQAAAVDPKQIELIQADITLEQDRNKILAKLGAVKLEYLVHNAGVVGPLVPSDKLDLGEFQSVMRTNVEAPIFLTQLLLPALEFNSKKSRILHVSSGCAHSASPSWLAYCVSKAAFLMAYRCLALDLEPKGILVGSFKPGIVDTEMQQEMRLASVGDFPKADFFKKLRQEQLNHHSGEEVAGKPHAPSRDRLDIPDNVAHFAWFLLHDTSDAEFPSHDWDIRDDKIGLRWIK
ncbi:hypothetical protein BASA81_006866 [Batrachochytrium salamandrivorans]|nr:hypothetical protein BASA81_006866 [Batrachochytrium salamandrivorans]